jgi:hypothetical protein
MFRLQTAGRALLVTFGACGLMTVAPPPAAGQHEPALARVLYQRDASQETERFTRALTIGRDGEIDLRNISGNIVVEVGEKASLEVVKRARGRDRSEARRQLGLLQVDVREHAGRAEIRARYEPGERNYRASADFLVTAPAGTRISANSISGNIRLNGIQGEVRLETVSGDVQVASAGRVAVAKSTSGRVELTGISAAGRDLSASSTSGSVRARDIKARGLTLASISGSVNASDVTAERVQLSTMSGSVEYDGRLVRGGRYELKSHSGDVRLIMAGDTGFSVDATTFSGSVRSTLPLTINAADTPDRRPRRHDRSLRGVHGDGSALVELTSFSGSIIISSR